MRKWYVSYLVKASIHFNRLPIELFIFIPFCVIVPIPAGDGTYGSGEISAGHVAEVAFTLFSAGMEKVDVTPGASIMISPFSLCTRADGEQD